MSYRDFIARRPLLTALVFEGLLIPVALGLALLLDLAPWADLEPTAMTVPLAVIATMPLVAALRLVSMLDLASFRALEDFVSTVLDRLFANARPGAVAAVALLAGFGEELLFRGVLQAGLAEHLPAHWAMLLVAVLFGLAHFVNSLYFMIATVFGVYLGALYHLTGNLLFVCLIHALYDWVAIHIYLRRDSPPDRRT